MIGVRNSRTSYLVPVSETVRLQQKVITKSDARAIVEAALSEQVTDIELVIIDDSTMEYEWGWVFFYQSKRYLETGDDGEQLAGNAPFIVNRTSGELVETGTALPVEHYVREYEKQIQVGAHGEA
jgi:hypothetical protein